MADTRSIVSALEDVFEARRELEQMRSEYTGYSPSYALHSWIEAEEKASKRFEDELSAYIDQKVSERLERKERE